MHPIKQAILRGAEAFDAARQFDDAERAKFMNASEAMTCIRKQWYEKHADHSEKDGPEEWGYARRGQHGELYLVERLRLANVGLLFAGKDQVGIADEDLRISCTPDGLIWGPSIDLDEAWYGGEFKTVDPRTNRANLPKEHNVRQLQIGMEMFERHRDEFPELGEYEIKSGFVIYMDASNYDEIDVYPVPRKPAILDQLKGRVNRILDSKSASRLPREGTSTPFKKECKRECMWNAKCGVDGAGSSTGQGRAGAGDLSTQRATYLSAKSAEAAAKAQKEQAAELIKAALKKEKKSFMQVDDGSVDLKEKSGSISYASVVKDHCPDVDLEPYRGKPSEQLTVK